MSAELAPLPDGYRQALERCSFVTPNMARTHAWAWTYDEEVAALLGSKAKHLRCSEPELYEYEISITHPDAVAMVCDIVDARRG